jgi:hypothetical protein
MGAFCVFGVSRQVCRKLAEKSVKTYVVENNRRRELAAPDWGVLVRAEGDRLFAESDKQVRISPELDAPQFCRDWIAAQPGDVRLTKLMCRGEKTDKHGAVVMRLGAPVLTWLAYDENDVWPRPFGEVERRDAVAG